MTFCNPNPNKQESESKVLRSGSIQERASTILDKTTYEICLLNKDDKEGYTPTNFKEAWWHPDINERNKWREAIRKELRDAIKRKVYRKTNRRNIPQNKRCVKCKWVFKRKSNGVYRARNVACGYSQIPNIDFTDSFSPVINDMSWKILIIVCIIHGLDIRLLDMETVFKHGELDVEIFMEPPEGIEDIMELDKKGECMELLVCTCI